MTRGDTLTLLLAARTRSQSARAAVAPTEPAAEPAPPVPQAARQGPLRGRGLSPVVHGTLAFDFDALDSETRWGGEQPGRSTRQFMTPALRIYATASQLPGGFRLHTNLRWDYRYTTGSTLGQTAALRIYQASLEKRFTSLPLELQLGRFYLPVDAYGGYWDGVMMRAGGRFGVGFAAGYEPDRANGRLVTDNVKATAFVDYGYRTTRFGYEAGVSAHQGSDWLGADERFLSWSQRLRLGRAYLQQRARLDAGTGWSAWSLSQLDLTALMPLIGDLAVRAQFARRSFDGTVVGADSIRPRHERKGVGLLFSGSNLSMSADVSFNDWSDGVGTRTWSASAGLLRTPLAGLGLGVAANVWNSETGESRYISPWLSRSFGTASARVAYQRYEAAGSDASDYQATALSLSFGLPAGLQATIRAQTQWGASMSGHRLFTSLWKSF
jgi:hypothetical protein